MIKFVVSLCVVAAFVLSSGCTQRGSIKEAHTISWDSMSRSGKGVLLVKCKDGDKSIYYLTSATNRVMPLNVVRHTGIRFTSLDSLLECVARRPADVLLIEATPENVKEDGGRLEPFSASERQQICKDHSPGKR